MVPARSLWLPGAAKPPPDCSAPNTPVPHRAAPAMTTAATSRTSRRRRYTNRPHASNIGPSTAKLLPLVYTGERCKLQTVLTSHTPFTIVKRVRDGGRHGGRGTEPPGPCAGSDCRRDQADGPPHPGGRGAEGLLAAGDRRRDGHDRPRPIPVLREPR